MTPKERAEKLFDVVFNFDDCEQAIRDILAYRDEVLGEALSAIMRSEVGDEERVIEALKTGKGE